MKTPLLNDRPDEPTPDRFGLPSWWPAETDRGMNRSWWITMMIPPFAGVIILLASGEWVWALLPLAVGIALVMTYRQVAVAERLLDEAERKLGSEDPVGDDREKRERHLAALSMLNADEDRNRYLSPSGVIPEHWPSRPRPPYSASRDSRPPCSDGEVDEDRSERPGSRETDTPHQEAVRGRTETRPTIRLPPRPGQCSD